MNDPHSGPSSSSAASPTANVRQLIISSLFNRRGSDGILEETYIAHLKVWEDAPDTTGGRRPSGGQSVEDVSGKKSRYLILAVNRQGRVYLHKAKRNANMTFSKGKTWNLEDLKAIKVHDQQTFELTMSSRSYVWQTERPVDQHQFLTTSCKVYRKYTQGKTPTMINFDINDGPGGSMSPDSVMSSTNEIPTLANASETLQPPRPSALRDRQNSASSNASSSLSGAEAYQRGAPSRPSLDSYRSAGTPGTTNDAMYSQSPTRGPHTISPLVPGRPFLSDEIDPRQPQHSQSIDDYNSPDRMRPPQQPVRRTTDGLANESMSSRLQTPPQANRTDDRGDAVRPAEHRAGAENRYAPLIREKDEHDGVIDTSQSKTTPWKSVAPIAKPTSSSDQLSRQSGDRPSLPPIITTTGPYSPNVQQEPHIGPVPRTASSSLNKKEGEEPKRGKSRRASFVPPPSITPYSRELLLRSFALPEHPAGSDLQDFRGEGDLEDETLANVEEMLEGFDWGMGVGSQQRGDAEAIEARLLDELNALEAANIHAFLESDDRINNVLNGIDEAMAELDNIDTHITGYKIQLNSVTEDIAYIESQNRGLQVQTTNQRALLHELEQLLNNVQVNPEQLRALTQESLESEKGIQSLESCLAALYKALLAVRDRDVGDMVAAAERMTEYETYNKQFCLRLAEYLFIMFKFQSDIAANNAAKLSPLAIMPHSQMEDQLGKYCGLILYMKEMDEERYRKLCANYFSVVSDLHSKEMKACLIAYMQKLRKPTDGNDDGTFSASAANHLSKQGAVARSKTVITNLRGNDSRKGLGHEGQMRASEAFSKALEQIALQINREEAFIADFLQITDSAISYADYMDLDSYFKRQANKVLNKGMSPATVKLHRSALDLIFGFLAGELKDWVEGAMQRERMHIFGTVATCEHFLKEAQAGNSMFFMNLMEKLHQRLQMMLDHFISDQVKTIEATKLTLKKRTGVIYFVRHFPGFVETIESQLVGCEDLDVRRTADVAYERIANSIFDTLTRMAKADHSDAIGGTEDKGQLNYFVIMIENMQTYAREVSKRDLPVLASYQQRAQAIYDENLSAYVKAVLRRSFGKQMDFFDSIRRQLDSSARPSSTSGRIAPSDIPTQPQFSRSALKRITKDAGSPKDLRKAIDALSKRVEKHFTIEEDDQTTTAESIVLIKEVWTSLERWLVSESAKWGQTLQECYGASVAASDGFEWGPKDVESTFRKAR